MAVPYGNSCTFRMVLHVSDKDTGLAIGQDCNSLETPIQILGFGFLGLAINHFAECAPGTESTDVILAP